MLSNKLYNFFLMFVFLTDAESTFDSIPDYLQQCYNDTITLMPLTINNFIEIIRKIEKHEFGVISMNTIVNSLVHRYWWDGIEFDPSIAIHEPEVIPYKTTGFQSYKFHILKHNMVPRIGHHFPDDLLTPSEKCTLHRMLSGSVEIWERGNEYTVCKVYFSNNITSLDSSGFRRSSCPIERGVISSKYFGTISPMHILLAISPILEPMNISLSYLIKNEKEKYISNKWISLIGDLAETMIIQTPILQPGFQFGPGGDWNDTDIPTEYYMAVTEESVLKKELWQFTNAEIFGAIDGLTMANEVLTWINQDRILKLSQILEAYYSPRRRSVQIPVHACMRNLFIDNLGSKKHEIYQQVESFSEVLVQNMPNYINNTNVIWKKSGEVVEQFIRYVKTLMWKPIKCPEGVTQKPKFKIYVSVDNSWTSYETLKFLLNLGEIIGVSSEESQMSVIASDSGQIIIENVHSLGDLYLRWNRTDITGIPSMVKSLLTIKDDLNKKKYFLEDVNDSYTYVAIFIALATVIGGTTDISNSIKLVNTIKGINPDMNFIYLTTPELSPIYMKLTPVKSSQNDKIITKGRHEKGRLLEELAVLNNLPTAIKPPPCRSTTQESKVFSLDGSTMQGEISYFRIHPYYFCSTYQLLIEIQNYDKGDLNACMARDEGQASEQCKEISMKDSVVFDILNPCLSRTIYGKSSSWNEECKPVYIRIFGKRSFGTCTDFKCKMPDEIPFTITFRGMKCSGGFADCNKSGIDKANVKLVLMTFAILSLLL